jgi:hypothetical protein
MATALLYIVNPHFLAIYTALDYGLYFLYFAARSDVLIFIPMSPMMSWIFSPIIRVMIKVIGDFSGSPNMRIPLFLGGFYYIFNLISAQASVLIAVHLYNVAELADEGNTQKISSATLWKMTAVLVGLWCVTIAFFLLRVVTPTHRHTFWSLVSGRKCCAQYFTEGATDEDKLGVFGSSRLLWESDIGSEVMEFTLQNWARWEREKPSWFTPLLKATVPDEYIPTEFLAGLGGAKRMRRGSAAGSVRESFRMIEAAGNAEDIEVNDDNDVDDIIEDVVEEVEDFTKVEAIKGVGVINDVEDNEEEKEVVMMEEGVVDFMCDID